MIKVDPSLFRGPNPTWDDVIIFVGLARKFHPGKRPTILNLQTHDSNDELSWCRTHGVQLINMDLPGIRCPEFRDIKLAVDIIADLSLRPLYVHCRHGRERTGLVIARYRMTCGWSATDAAAEMRAMGCRWPWSWIYTHGGGVR